MANKTKFLSDILAVVSDCLQEAVDCNVKQVLKGKDAEGANRLLQNLAKAADILHLDGVEAVQVSTMPNPVSCDKKAFKPHKNYMY
jgi:sugar/nucleoside kinase (ribokinase family)